MRLNDNTMLKTLALIFLISFSSVVQANKNDGHLFLKYCSYSLKAPETINAQEFGGIMFCYGVLHGINGMQQVAKKEGRQALYCPPSDFSVDQGSRIVIKYLKEHPEKLHMKGSDLFINALKDVFPCKNKTDK